MRRRALLALAGGTVAGWPLRTRAQQPLPPLVGNLSSTTSDVAIDYQRGLDRGLREAGFTPGENLTLVSRWAGGNYEILPALAAELVAQRVSVILAAGLPATLAAKQTSTTIPIVFVIGGDPVSQGIVASLARPGGNLTGVTEMYGEVGSKRLELLRDIAPAATVIAVLSNPRNPNAEEHLRQIRAAARGMDKRIEVITAGTEVEIDQAFDRFRPVGAGAALIVDDPLYRVRREQIVALAERHALPTIHFGRDFVTAGGLISYGSSSFVNARLAGGHIARILRGAAPSELPVLQPTDFALIVNLKTARALGLTFPEAILFRADEVLE